jgi:hypothetical protein
MHCPEGLSGISWLRMITNHWKTTCTGNSEQHCKMRTL